MGSQHSHEKGSPEGGGGSGGATPRGGSRRGTSAGDSEPEAAPSPLVPVEKLGKILSQRSQKEDGINGVTETVFVKYLFPKYPGLGSVLFQHFLQQSKASGRSGKQLSPGQFRLQAERLLALLDDGGILETYVRMFNGCEEEVSRGGLRALLRTGYQLSMDHYPDGPRACFMVEKTLTAIVEGCFGARAHVSAGACVRWLREHCPRLVLPVHRYAVHVITTSHRSLSAPAPAPPSSGLGLATPVLDEGGGGAGGGAGGARGAAGGGALLSTSASWLIAAAAPPSYSLPHAMPHPGGISSSAWVSRLVCLVPVHWAPLYLAREHGLGANRFLHHVTSYRGPTIMLVSAGEVVLVVACPLEWRESTLYWGGPDSALMQLYPTFSVLERAPKMLYLNTHLRGAPRGLRAGADPARPLLALGEDFDTLTFQGKELPLRDIEVWGCGDTSSRETQLEIKKWQVREAERQRQVKLSAADWIEHPDRYLLELAGRPQYNTSAS